jgi:MFS family permease
LTGLSTGMVMFPAMSAVSQYFHTRRGAAMGLTIAGSSLGAVVFPVVLSQLLNGSDIGFGWSVRVCAFIMLPVLTFASVVIKAPATAPSVQLLPRRGVQGSRIRHHHRLFLFPVGWNVHSSLLPPVVRRLFRGMDERLASYLSAILNSASILGRIVPGILGDRLGRMNALCAAGVATAILILVWIEAISVAGSIIVFAVFIGFTS